MSKSPDLAAIQTALRVQGLHAWLFYDHHARDTIAYRVLGLDATAHITRRWYYLVPAEGEPRKLVHRIEAGRLDSLPGEKRTYSSWQEHEAALRQMVAPYPRLAMQYSPNCAVPTLSIVDAGTVELLRSFGNAIVSSADLVATFEAVLTPEQVASHYTAQQAIDAILGSAFTELRTRLNAGRRTTEHDLMLFLTDALEAHRLVWENNPDVSVNENTSDSHYAPTAAHAREIKEGDFLLIDIWGKTESPGSVFYDVTWTGVVGREPTAREQQVFTAVCAARDAAIHVVQEAFAAAAPIAGWQADAAARAVIEQAGFGEFFTHRTGHNIATAIHGNGANLDNLETHDERLLLPNTCFSVEPGVYLPEFGIRSEINMITTPSEARVTGRVQKELVRI
jgi:Xaa-Pro aminopeptidase